eukprot:1190421-Prorocentrum_minimum.AAC.3
MRIYPGRGPIEGGTGGYTRGGDQSEEGQEDRMPAAQPCGDPPMCIQHIHWHRVSGLPLCAPLPLAAHGLTLK